MKARFVTLLLLLAVAGGLTWVAWRDEQTSRPSVAGGMLYPGLDTGAITSLHLQLVHGQTLDLERDPGGPWRITHPTDEIARDDLVAVLLDNLARAQVLTVEQQGPAVAPEDVGLEPPEHVIRFGGEGWSETLLLGEVESLGRMVYARRAGDVGIVLATRNLVSLLKYNGQDFVDTRALRGLRGTHDLVRIESAVGVHLLARREAGRWVIEEPIAARADQGAVSSLARRLASITVEGVAFPRPTSSDFHAAGLPTRADFLRGDLAGATYLQLGAVGQEPVGLLAQAGARQSGRHALVTRDDFAKILRVEAETLAALDRPLAHYRSKRVLPPVRERARRLRIEGPDGVVLDIRRDGTGRWTFHEPEALEGRLVEARLVDGSSPLTRLFSRVDGLEAVGFTEALPDARLGRLVVEWDRAGEQRTDVVELAPHGERVAARSSERPEEVLLLERGPVEELLARITGRRLRSTSPVDLPLGAVRRAHLRGPDFEATLGIEPDGGTTGDDAWGRRFGLVSDVVTRLQGIEWVPARDDDLARWSWDLVLEGEGGEVLGRLEARRPLPDEPAEVQGRAASRLRWSGVPGMELVADRSWWDRFDALRKDPQRR